MSKFAFWILAALVSSNVHSLERLDEAEVLRCAALKEPAARLECFENFALGILDRRTASQEATPDEGIDEPEPMVVASDLDEDFRKKSEDKSAEEQIRSKITIVTKSAMGHRVMSLANGQVWMENEAGRRRIEPEDEIVITQRRFRYVMKFTSGPVVAVHRVE